MAENLQDRLRSLIEEFIGVSEITYLIVKRLSYHFEMVDGSQQLGIDTAFEQRRLTTRPERKTGQLLFLPQTPKDLATQAKRSSWLSADERAELLTQLCHSHPDLTVRKLQSYCRTTRQLVGACEDIADALRLLWVEDAITEPELEIALSFLLVAFRKALLSVSPPRYQPLTSRVLVSTLSGEPHFQLGSMATQLLEDEGMEVSDGNSSKPDCRTLILYTSPIFTRQENTEQIRVACASARQKIGKDGLLIVLGRFCQAPKFCLKTVGADIYCQSALELPELILKAA